MSNISGSRVSRNSDLPTGGEHDGGLLVGGEANDNDVNSNADRTLPLGWNAENYDDVSDADGKFLFSGGQEARQLIEGWHITAVGNRPIDHMARDLLAASHYRDPNQWAFRRLAASTPTWILHRIPDEVIRPLSSVATKATVVEFLHYRHLYQLAACVDPKYQSIVEQLLRCWPYGLQVEWHGPGKRTYRDVCGLSRLCPFCFCRTVMSLYDRLEPSFSLRGQRCFLLASAKLSVDLEEDLDLPAFFRRVRKRISRALISDAKAAGATGGLITFAVSPITEQKWTGANLEHDPLNGLEVCVGVLAQIPNPRRAVRDLDNSGRGPAIQALDRNNTLRVDYSILRRSQDLRLAVTGGSFGYRANDGRKNFPAGVFAWPSWNLSDAYQWVAHREATKDMRHFNFWGDWIGKFPESVRATTPPFVNFRDRGGNYHRELAFARENQKRNELALHRREGQLRQLQSLIVNNPTLGTCGAATLRSRLKDRQIVVSDRDARWLRQQLVEQRSGVTAK